MLLAVAFSVDACMATQHVVLGGQTDLDHASGITTRSGREVPFARPGASIVNDTMYAAGSAGRLSIPVDSIATVSRKKFSTTRTVALVGGLVAGATLVALAIIATSNFNFFSGP
jgi:hypothetical protein